MFMLPLGASLLDWDFNVDGPIIWKTHGYEGGEDANSRSYRQGMLRVDVLGSSATVLRQKMHELSWMVEYETEMPAKCGVESITLQPGVPGGINCFGHTFSGCWFDPRPSMEKAGIAFSELCKRGYDENGTTVFGLDHPGHAPMLLEWINSGALAAKVLG